MKPLTLTDMRILISHHDQRVRRELDDMCRSWGYDVVMTSGTRSALKTLAERRAPLLALVQWGATEEADGRALLQLRRLRQLRAEKSERPVYVILISENGPAEVTHFQPEADDYVAQPFDQRALRARIQVGFRVVRLHVALTERVLELESALSRVKSLQGLLPMCSYCKRIRNDRNYWQQVESYIAEHSDAEFTHGVCPHCYETIVKRELEQLQAQ